VEEMISGLTYVIKPNSSGTGWELLTDCDLHGVYRSEPWLRGGALCIETLLNQIMELEKLALDIRVKKSQFESLKEGLEDALGA
jgi:hypothetical protein